jgi:hypothetical protein
VAAARGAGIGTAATFIIIDLRYVSTGRISRIYLLDAALEAFWLGAWATHLAMPRKLCTAGAIDGPASGRTGSRSAFSRKPGFG